MRLSSKSPVCPTCGKDCGWMDRYLYRCEESLGDLFYIPLFSRIETNKYPYGDN